MQNVKCFYGGKGQWYDGPGPGVYLKPNRLDCVYEFKANHPVDYFNDWIPREDNQHSMTSLWSLCFCRPPPPVLFTHFLPTLHLCSLSSLLSFWSHLPPPPPQQVHYSPGSGVNLGWTPSLDFIGASRYLVLLLPFELVSCLSLYVSHHYPPNPSLYFVSFSIAKRTSWCRCR